MHPAYQSKPDTQPHTFVPQNLNTREDGKSRRWYRHMSKSMTPRHIFVTRRRPHPLRNVFYRGPLLLGVSSRAHQPERASTARTVTDLCFSDNPMKLRLVTYAPFGNQKTAKSTQYTRNVKETKMPVQLVTTC